MLHEDWVKLVEEYSRRSLTQQTDKLVAFSGIAKKIADKFYIGYEAEDFIPTSESMDRLSLVCSEEDDGLFPSIVYHTMADSYKAGLWSGTFIVDLSWRVAKQETKAVNRTSYLAPSWSWASASQAVRYDYFLERNSCEPDIFDEFCVVEEVTCQATLASDPTGSLKDAYAIITGKLVGVELVILDEKLGDLWHSKYYRPWVQGDATDSTVLVRAQNLGSVEIFLDHPRESSTRRTVRETDFDSDCWVRGTCRNSRCCYKPESSGKAHDTCLYCLKLFESDEDVYYSHRSKGVDEWFLVLEKLVGVESVYERIGVGVWNSHCDRRVKRSAVCPLFTEYEINTIRII